LCEIIEISGGNIARIKNILKVEDIKKAIKDDEEIRISLCKLEISFD